MSEIPDVEQEQEAPEMRERATGRLLPRWFTIPFYISFAAFTVFSTFYIIASLRKQARLNEAIARIKGGMQREPIDLGTDQGKRALQVLREHMVESFLYLNEDLLQKEQDDPRMARAMALRKAVQWGKLWSRREALLTVVEHMTEEGGLEPGFELSDRTTDVLRSMVEERRAEPDTTFVEDQITEVLDWLATGHPGEPKGPERRRVEAVLEKYTKKRFVGEEVDALQQLREQWLRSPEPVQREAAEKFAKMLEEQVAHLSREAARLCTRRADQLEDQFRLGMVGIATAGRRMVEAIVEHGEFVDHPHIYQYIDLLSHRFEGVRREVAKGAWLLRHNEFTIRFLSYFATKTTINPFMAVETLRLTREEHQRIMRRANRRSMEAAVRLLGRIGTDYVQNPDAYAHLDVPDVGDYVRSQIVGALQEVENEETVAELVADALERMRRADLAREGGPLLFKPRRPTG